MLALNAFEEAVADSRLSQKVIRASDTALIGANTVGGMCLTESCIMMPTGLRTARNTFHPMTQVAVNIYLQERYGLTGVINTINTACSSSANAMMYGARLIRHGFAKRAIVGGTDSLAKFTINGFNALFILSPDLCQPFDAHRKGLNLGEGAGFLVLEHESEVQNKKVYAELNGWSNANDAFHPSSLSEAGEGPALAMKKALLEAGLSPSDIGYINTHGTGTENNDEVESRAMINTFGKVPAFTSTKANIGHTLGAAGAIEAIYSVLNIHHQEVYPGLGFQEAIPETQLVPCTKVSATTFEKCNVQFLWLWRKLFVFDLFEGLIRTECFIFIILLVSLHKKVFFSL